MAFVRRFAGMPEVLQVILRSSLLIYLAAATTLAQGTNSLDAQLFDGFSLPRFRIELPPESVAILTTNGRTYAKGKVFANGHVFNDVGVRLKGKSSFRPVHEKPGLALKFDEFVSGQQFCGLDKVLLNNSAQDPTYLTEIICLGLFRDAGLPAPRATHATVNLDGRDLGLYVLSEPINKQFLRRHFASAKGNLYEGFLADIDQNLDLDSGIDLEQRDLKVLVQMANLSDPEERWIQLNRFLDVDRFITHLVLEMLTGNTDGYALNANNYRIYGVPTSGRFVLLGHGHDVALQHTNFSMLPPMKSLLVRAALNTREGARAYRNTLQRTFTNCFQVEVLTNRIHRAVARLKAAKVKEASECEYYATGLQTRIAARARVVAEQLQIMERERFIFDAQGYAQPANWRSEVDSGAASLAEVLIQGRKTLHISTREGGCWASWRSRGFLEEGTYRFEGTARGEHIEPFITDVGSGAGLRISGRHRTNSVEQAEWTPVAYIFSVPATGLAVELVCELRAKQGAAWFDRDSIKLIRVSRESSNRQ